MARFAGGGSGGSGVLVAQAPDRHRRVRLRRKANRRCGRPIDGTSVAAAGSGGTTHADGGGVQAQDERPPGSHQDDLPPGYTWVWNGDEYVGVPAGTTSIPAGRNFRKVWGLDTVSVTPPVPEPVVRGARIAGATVGLVGNGLEGTAAVGLRSRPTPR